MKDELVQLLVEKVGLEKSVAVKAVDEVVDFLAARLPEPYNNLVNVVLGDGAGEDGFGLDDAANLLGGLFGGKN